jgi:hypothetical protein
MSDNDKKPDAFEHPYDRYFHAIGEMVAAWGVLEAVINEAIWSLACVEDRDGACITAQLSGFMPRMRALIALVGENGGGKALLTDLNKFAEEGDALARRRNRVAHDPWLPDKAGGLVRLEITANRKLIFERKAMTVTDLGIITNEIWEAIQRFDRLRDRIGSDLAASLPPGPGRR